MNTNLEKDFKKWIIFNKQLDQFQNVYELYSSIDKGEGMGKVKVKRDHTLSDAGWVVEQDGYDVAVEINGENDRRQFLDYLTQLFIAEQNIEDWYKSKVQDRDKSDNHEFLSASTESTKIDFRVHPKELFYYRVRMLFSACFYLAVTVFTVASFLTSLTAGLITVTMLLGIILFLFIVKSLGQGFFIGMIKGSSVKLNEQQYPEAYGIVKAQSKALGLAETPEVYVLHGHFNAFVTKFARKKYLVLHSEVLETIQRGNFAVLKFVIGHELGHLKRRHLSLEKWLVPSSFIPFLKQAHSRGCEYTCDRIGYHFSDKGATEGILILATGKEISSRINVARYVKDSNVENTFWVRLSEKFLSHPYAFKRMTAVKEYAEKGY